MFFETERLIARRFGPRDLEAFVAMRDDPEIARFQSWSNFTLDEGLERLAVMKDLNPGDPGWFQIALVHRESSNFIGDCGLRIMENDHRLAQIGYTIVRQFWNRGFATETVIALRDYAFANFSIHRITASVDPRNIASCRVLEKAGFNREGLLRQSEWFKGEWADDAIYAMLRGEWLSSKITPA